MGEALWNGVLHLFVTFWFLWCLIPNQCWHSRTHKELTGKSASGEETHGRCLNVRAQGQVGVSWCGGDKMASLSWSQAGTAQIHTKLTIPTCKRTANSSFLIWAFLPSFLFYLRLLLKVLLLLLRCPGPECPVITRARAWHCHVSPWHDQTQVSLAWGWEPSDFSYQKCFPRNQLITAILHWKCTLKNE